VSTRKLSINFTSALEYEKSEEEKLEDLKKMVIDRWIDGKK